MARVCDRHRSLAHQEVLLMWEGTRCKGPFVPHFSLLCLESQQERQGPGCHRSESPPDHLVSRAGNASRSS